MPDVLTVAIGIGLALSLAFSELFALAAGGMIVPGYTALALHEPLALAATLLVAVATWGVVTVLARVLVLYGRRLTVLTLLIGFLLNVLLSHVLATSVDDPRFVAIGHLVPGLVALWFERQGVLATLATLVIASVLVRLVLILLYGTELVA